MRVASSHDDDVLGSRNDGDDCDLAMVKYRTLWRCEGAGSTPCLCHQYFLCIGDYVAARHFPKSASISKNATGTHSRARSESKYELHLRCDVWNAWS